MLLACRAAFIFILEVILINEEQSRVYDKLSEISERLARVEVLLSELTGDVRDMKTTLRDHETRINELESHKDATIGMKDVITWLVMAGIALWGVLK